MVRTMKKPMEFLTQGLMWARSERSGSESGNLTFTAYDPSADDGAR